MKFNKLSSDTFNELQLGAGVMLSSFDPSNPTEPDDTNILFATTGGINVSCVPTMTDLGEDIDNCPNGVAELQRTDSWTCTISTTALSVSPEAIAIALGAADIANSTHVTARKVTISDFRSQLWWVGEQGENGMVAIKLSNALSTGGFTLQTTKNGKGQVSLTIQAFPRLANPDVVPMDFWSVEGTTSPSVSLDRNSASVAYHDSITLTATVYPLGTSVTWTSSNTNKASVSNGVVYGEALGTATITAKITVNGVDYTDTCSVTVEDV